MARHDGGPALAIWLKASKKPKDSKNGQMPNFEKRMF
jgi:hypothetical protein